MSVVTKESNSELYNALFPEDEIKKILENVKKCCDITKEQSFTVYQRQDILKLLDYITNLQEENENLKDYLKIMEKGKDNNLNRFLDYKSRNEKAIEYIKNKQELNKMFGTITLSKDSQKELLNILGGDDND